MTWNFSGRDQSIFHVIAEGFERGTEIGEVVEESDECSSHDITI